MNDENIKLAKFTLSIIYFSLLIILVLKLSFSMNGDKIENICHDHMKKPEECFITIHNFVKFNSTALISKFPGTNDVQWKTNQNFKTYIYSYTKPYLIELIQNSTNDCLCCTKR